MSPRLESLPSDILQHIAFLSASASLLDSPVVILSLLQTCSSLYRVLNMHDAPDLYAHIFSAKFDQAATSRRYPGKITNSALAGELVNRYRLLRRARRSDFSSAGLLQDLWTALWMLLENDELNILQLSAVNFTDFILRCSRTILRRSPTVTVDHRTDDKHDMNHIIVWLLCLSLRRRVILDMSKEDRDDLYGAIAPFVFLSNKISDSLPSKPPPPSISYANDSDLGRRADGPLDGPLGRRLGEPCSPFSGATCSSAHILLSAYLKYSRATVPDPSTAAINLISVIHEATPLQVPHHLPETRAIANASQRSGPTQEDYRIITSYQTRLFADHIPLGSQEAISPALTSLGLGSRLHDLQFCDLLKIYENAATCTDAFRYIPGTLSGLWEGTYRTINVLITSGTLNQQPVESTGISTSIASVVFIRPMQCQITEYICTMPATQSSSTMSDVLTHNSLLNCFDVSGTELVIDGRTYRKYPPQSQCFPNRRLNSLYDVILVGETLEDHSNAWGGYKFSGRVYKDGNIVLRREAMTASSHQSEGVWIFVGRLQPPAMILGRWRITGAPDGASLDHGVFSMGRSRQ